MRFGAVRRPIAGILDVRRKDGERVEAFTGYCSLVAAINRALEEDIPFIDPEFYSTCSDEIIAHIFRPAPRSKEPIPLLKEQIVITHEILVEGYHDLRGQEVYFLKRAQILVAETWTAFFPSPSPPNRIPHHIFPGGGIHQLTMFVDYRVPQILQYLKVLTYPPSLLTPLESGHHFEHGSKEEVSIRAANIVAVERVRDEILALRHQYKEIVGAVIMGGECGVDVPMSSAPTEFYLWDTAKQIEEGGEIVVSAHRTRNIWD